MSKLTFEEIIERLKEAYNSVDDFAFGESCLVNVDDYPEAVKALEKRHKFREENYIDRKWTEGSYDIFITMTDGYKIAKDLFLNNLNINHTEVDQYGGEGCGDTWYSVKYFPDSDIYIRVDGWYQSYNGTEFNGWDDCKEVKPIEKVVTFYQ